MKTFQDAVVVVTGAGSGIGRALAQQLASHGAQLALADVNNAALEETRSLLPGANVKTYMLDVADAPAVKAFAQKVEVDFGRVSVLINNAGVALYGTFSDLSLEEFDWLFRINFWGVVHGCKFFLPLLRREPEAHIVNLSSIFGLIASPGQTAYSASKFAVRGFTQALSRELDGTRISLTCVHPGGVLTRITENARSAAATAPNPQMLAERKERFSKLARTSPEKAAQEIVQGILKNKARVLIGTDAYRIDILQRLFPVRCSVMMASLLNRKFANRS
jgi:NAD(P)-dependent dehydrogenase (short-subunit alcohol dehydrogenase family)